MGLELRPESLAVSSARLPFAEQIQFFRGKVNLPTRRWTDIMKNAHDRAFVVAGAMKADLIADLRTAVDGAIAEGKSIGWFRDQFDAIVAKHGWTGWTGEGSEAGRAWRTRVIYQTNLSTSYAAGRLAQMSASGLPLWMYKHSDSVLHPRPLHVSWDGLTLPAGHAWFATHAPPNGWGCKCRLVAVSERTAGRLGGRITDTPPDDGSRTVRGDQVPNGIDYGWDYMPGADVADELTRLATEKARALPPPVSSAFASEVGRSRWDLSTESGRWHDASWAHAPDWLQDAVERTGDIPVSTTAPNTCFNWSWRIDMVGPGHRPDTPRGKSVWRHEFGHAMDYKLRTSGWGRSEQADFIAAMEADGHKLLSGSGLVGKSKSQAAILGHNRKAAPDLLAKLQAMPGAAERTALLRKMAKDVGLDYNDFAEWFSENASPGDLDRGGLARDWWAARALSAWKRGDAKGFLDALERVERDSTGKRISSDRGRAYDKGGAGMISDLFSAATNKRVEGCGWHTESYYQQSGIDGRARECWANLTTIEGMGKIGGALLDRFTPTLKAVWKGAL